jgi:hypothetical protein
MTTEAASHAAIASDAEVLVLLTENLPLLLIEFVHWSEQSSIVGILIDGMNAGGRATKPLRPPANEPFTDNK